MAEGTVNFPEAPPEARRQRAIDAEPNLSDYDLAGAVAHAFSLSPKRVASKWLYDSEGSRLFDQIVESPGYYLPRAEMAILRRHGAEIANALGPDVSLVELGSGSSMKVRLLLDVLERPNCYVPIEISENHLAEAAAAIRRDYPGLTVAPLADDYTKSFALPPVAQRGRIAAFFPGSTLCNLLPFNSIGLLRRMRPILGPGSRFIVGVDLKKDEETLLRAYNDPGAAIWNFNLNFLERMNRELGTALDRADFRHEAIYNRVAGRIESSIYPLRDLAVTVAGRDFVLKAEEPIVLEYSHKYRVEEFQELAREADWTPSAVWTDPDELFSVHLLANA